MDKISPFAKFYVALTTGMLTVATEIVVSEPSRITSAEWVQVVGVAVGAGLVWLVPNGEPS